MKNVNILKKGSTVEKGEEAQVSFFIGAIAVSDLVKTTLGPKGMDKILISTGEHSRGEIQVTNDGATILKSIQVDNPTAKVLVDISKTQDEEVGDGTTSVCVLAGELLREAEKLLEKKIHPQTIISGYRKSVDIAYKTLEKHARDNSNDPEKFREDLLNIARTTLSSKILSTAKDHFANLAVDAVLRLKGSTDLDRISIIKKPGDSLEQSYLDDGFILEKKFGISQSKKLENAKILIANTPMDTDKIKIYSAVVETNSTTQVAEIEETEREKMYQKCQKIIDHGVNLFINRQLIYNLPEQYFTDRGVSTIEHADFSGVERLALVLGGEVVSTFDNPELVKLGTAKCIEEIMIGEDKVLKFSGCGGGEACAIVLRGANSHILEEAERSLHDALCVLSQMVKNSKVVWGAGCSEMLMAQAVDELALKTEGKEALAIEGFARALRMIPTILADNAGFDTAELISKLKAQHSKGNHTFGINMDSGEISDISVLKITESFKVKSQILISSTEAAEMILRVDQIISSAPRERTKDPRYPGN